MSTPTKILIVDDERAVAITLALVFKAKGFETQSANSGAEALELARSFRPDVLVTDVMMPGMDGFELAEKIFDELPGCRIFLLSGAAQTIPMERITNLKMDALLIAKPVAPPTLLNIVSSKNLPTMSFQPTVLLVDDYEPHRYSLSRMLENSGFRVIQAANGEECLQKAKDADLVLLDIHLPDISGFEVCKQLRAHDDTKTIPVVHHTSTYKNDAAEEESWTAGANQYLSHPIEPKLLISTLRQLIQIYLLQKTEPSASEG
jgi:CheY-like chemotaxis protein